jgi:hypothetical protein
VGERKRGNAAPAPLSLAIHLSPCSSLPFSQELTHFGEARALGGTKPENPLKDRGAGEPAFEFGFEPSSDRGPLSSRAPTERERASKAESSEAATAAPAVSSASAVRDLHECGFDFRSKLGSQMGPNSEFRGVWIHPSMSLPVLPAAPVLPSPPSALLAGEAVPFVPLGEAVPRKGFRSSRLQAEVGVPFDAAAAAAAVGVSWGVSGGAGESE